MKILNALVKIAKKIMHAIAGMFKDKTPSEVINEVAKTATAVTTTGLIAYAGINSIRVHLMSSKKKNKNSSERKTGPELLREGRENSGSVEERFAEVKRSTANLLNKKSSSISKEDQEILKSIAKTRNIFFQNLSPEEQLNVLEIEGFNFKEYKDNLNRRKQRPLFPWGKHLNKLGVSQTDKPFRETPDYGFFGFILEPLDDFMHWLRNDPVPKKVPQIQVVDHPEIPDIPCETAFDVVDAARSLDSYLSHNNPVSSNVSMMTPAELEEQAIYSEELFKHKSFKKYKKAVTRRMMQSQYNTPNIFDLMDDDDLKKDKKKKKEKKKSKKSYYDFDEEKSKKKKKKDKRNGMSKEEYKEETEADKRAKELYRYHLEKAMNGEIDRKGYKYGF